MICVKIEPRYIETLYNTLQSLDAEQVYERTLHLLFTRLLYHPFMKEEIDLFDLDESFELSEEMRIHGYSDETQDAVFDTINALAPDIYTHCFMHRLDTSKEYFTLGFNPDTSILFIDELQVGQHV